MRNSFLLLFCLALLVIMTSADETVLHKHLLKIESLRNRRLHDPNDPKTVPAALDVQLLRHKREGLLANEVGNLLEHVRLKTEAMDRVQKKMNAKASKPRL